jgi:hypothetical protein
LAAFKTPDDTKCLKINGRFVYDETRVGSDPVRVCGRVFRDPGIAAPLALPIG